MALGQAVQNIVTDKENDAKKFGSIHILYNHGSTKQTEYNLLIFFLVLD